MNRPINRQDLFVGMLLAFLCGFLVAAALIFSGNCPSASGVISRSERSLRPGLFDA